MTERLGAHRPTFAPGLSHPSPVLDQDGRSQCPGHGERRLP